MPTSPIVVVDTLYERGVFSYLTPEEEFSLFILSDGYSSKSSFDDDCLALINRLKNIYPFGLLADRTLRLTIYSGYTGNSAALALGTGPYDPATAPSGMGAYYRTTGTFHLDYVRVAALVQATTILSDWPLAFGDGAQALPGAIVVLLPEQHLSGASSVSITSADLGQMELEHMPTAAEPLFFVATSLNFNYERIVARALGLAVGLGSEHEENPGAPTPEQAQEEVSPYPNLIYAPNAQLQSGPVEPNFQWRNLVGSRSVEVFNKPLAVNAPPDNSTAIPVDAPIQLWEGGGGYSNNVYRAAQTCIMRQRPGFRAHQAANIKAGTEPFCPYCQVHLTKALRGDVSTKRLAYPTLTTQRSEYDRVNWLHAEPSKQALRLVVDHTHLSVQGPRFTVTDTTSGVDNTSKAFWGYTCVLNGVDGFVLQELNVFQGTYLDENSVRRVSPRTQGRDVIRQLRFTDLVAVFDDNSTYSFDVAAIIGAGKFNFTHAWQGDLGDDTLYQGGMQLTHVCDDPTLPELHLDLSVVLRRAMDDFDPGRTAAALMLYPQITFRWAPRPGVSKRVVRFEGRTEITASVKHYHKMAGMELAAHSSGAGSSSCSLFADSNMSQQYTGTTLLRREDLELYSLATRPTWAGIFDYYQPDVTRNGTVKSFTAVHGPQAGNRFAQRRRLYANHRVEPNKTTPIFVRKMPRQGAYDNIHVMGAMGMHGLLDCNPGSSSVAQLPMVAAPFCGVDCLHFHWRWATLTDTIALILLQLKGKSYHNGFGYGVLNPESFRGWDGPNSHQCVGAPLLPPNQEVVVTLQETNSTVPVRAGDKLVIYATSVHDPQPDTNQVTLEQGLGWAMTYGAGAATVEFAVTQPSLLTPDGRPLRLSQDREFVFRNVYDYIRFHHNVQRVGQTQTPLSLDYKVDIFPYAQVPEGTDASANSWPTPGILDGWYLTFLTKEKGVNITDRSTFESV